MRAAQQGWGEKFDPGSREGVGKHRPTIFPFCRPPELQSINDRPVS